MAVSISSLLDENQHTTPVYIRLSAIQQDYWISAETRVRTRGWRATVAIINEMKIYIRAL